MQNEITDEMVEAAYAAWLAPIIEKPLEFEKRSISERIYQTHRKGMRAALEAVAPLLERSRPMANETILERNLKGYLSGLKKAIEIARAARINDIGTVIEDINIHIREVEGTGAND